MFLISSVIYFKNKSLTYSSSRSVFSPQERERQTLKTIESIKKNVPNAKIILIESGLRKDISEEIISAVNEYVYTGNNQFVRYACDSKKKGLGEAMSLFFGLKNSSTANYSYCFKISGRYYLNENFNLENFKKEKYFTFKFYDNPKQMSTRLYGFNIKQFAIWRKILKDIFIKLIFNYSIEELLYLKIKNNNNQEINVLGVSGLIGPNGEEINE